MNKMNRLTFRLTDDLLAATKRRAREMGIGHHEYIRGVLATDVARPSPAEPPPVTIPGVTD